MSVRSDDPTRNKIAWKWSKGALTTTAELGTPTTTTSYLLCVYDGTDAPILTLSIPAGGTCGDKPCWKETSSGFSYRNKDGDPNGVKGLSLSVGRELPGTAKISLKGGGADLPIPTLPLVQAPDAVRILLINDAGSASWCASYSTPAATDPLSSARWKDKND